MVKTVALNVGDGAAATRKFIHRQIISRFGNPLLNQMEDSTHLLLNDNRLVVTTDSYVVNPPIFPGGNIGKLAVTGTVNDLVASGARPLFLTFGLILEEGFPYSDLEVILDAMQVAVQESEIKLVAGDTKVVERGACSSLAINTTGLGVPVNPANDYALTRAQTGDHILITGMVGNHSLAVLSLREGLGFELRVKSDCAALDKLILPLLEEFNSIHCLRDLTRGGLINALVDLAEASASRVILDVASVPVQTEVTMGCEMLGIDPLSMVNEGKMILVVDPMESAQVLHRLQIHHLGVHSAIIGHIAPSPKDAGELIMIKKGVQKLVDRPIGEAIPRLC